MKKILLVLILIASVNSYSQINVYRTKSDKFLGIIKYNNTSVLKATNSFKNKIGVLNTKDTITIIGIIDEGNSSFGIVDYKNKRGFIFSNDLMNLEEYKKFKTLISKKNKETEEVLNKKREKELKSKCQYNFNGYDAIDKKNKKYTEYYNLFEVKSSNKSEKKLLEIRLFRVNKTKYIQFYTSNDLGCTSPYNHNKSYVKIKLKNNKIITLENIDEINCGDYKMTSILLESQIKALSSSPIESIRLSGTDYYQDYKEFKWKTFFIDKLKCIK